MRKRTKLLAILLLGAAVGASVLAMSACSGSCNGNPSNPGADTDITDPDVPLGPGECKHEAVKHVSATKPGCETSGNIEYWFCNDCGKYYSNSALTVETSLASVVIGAVGHNYGTLIDGEAADCEHGGVMAHYHCSVCQKDFDADKNPVTDLVIPAAPHAYGDLIKEEPATCEHTGVIAHYHCSACKKDFDADKKPVTDLVIPVASHTYGDWIEEQSASCTQDGVKAHYHCSACGKDYDKQNNVIEDLVIAGGHEYGLLIPETPAGVCTDGVKAHYHCGVCGTDFDENKVEFNGLPEPIGNGFITIPAPHDLVLINAKPATCEEDGVMEDYRHCNACGKNFDPVVMMELEEAPTTEKLGHDYPDDYTYDYADNCYKKICRNDETHVRPLAAGITAGYPYLAKDSNFKAVLALGGYIELKENVTIDELVTVSKDTVIKLNKFTISNNMGAGRPIAVAENVSLAIENGSIVIPEDNIASYGLFALSLNDKLRLTDVVITANTDAGALIRARECGCEITLERCTVTTNYLIVTMQFKSGQTPSHTLSGKLTVTGGEYNLIEKDSTLTTGEKSNFYAGFNVWSNKPEDVSILNAEFTDVAINTVSRTAVSVSAATVTYNNCTIGNPQENADYGYLNSAVSTSWGGKVTVNGGTYKAKYAAYVFNSSGTIEINGGTFIGNFQCDTSNNAPFDSKIIVNKTDSEFVWDETAYKFATGGSSVNNKVCVYENHRDDIKHADCSQVKWTLNAEKGIYEKHCPSCKMVVETSNGDGSVEYPYLISSEAEWVAFAKAHDETTVTTEKEDVHYLVTSNLDFTNVTERVDVFHFTGTIDFGGHSVRGITKENSHYWYGATTGLFVLTHDATIKNLDYELAYFGSANALALPVLFVWRGDVVLDNVTVSGNATHASNNATAFVYFAWANAYNSITGASIPHAAISLTFKNCTNRANITNTGASATSGYAAAFLGQVVGNSAGNTVKFINCVNEGTITGYHYAAMLMANQCSAPNINTLVVENCVNNGKIYSGIANGASLVIGDTSSGSRKEYNAANSGEGKLVNGANGVTTNIAINTLAIGEDGNYVINAVDGATTYKMEFVFSVRDDVNLDENGKPIHWGTTNITIDVNTDSKVKALAFVDFQDVEGYEKNEFGLYVTADGKNYVITQSNPELQDLRMLAQPTVYLTAYNAEGEVVGVSTCYLGDVLNTVA